MSMTAPHNEKFAFVAGSALLDIVSTVTEWRHIEDNIGTTTLNFGGVAYNVAVNLRKLDVPTTLCTALNDSPITQMVLNELTRQQVRTHIKRDKTLPDAIYNGIFHQGEEIASVWVNTVEGVNFSEDFIAKGMKNAVCVLITSCLSVQTMNRFIAQANKQNIPVFIGGASLMEVQKLKDITGHVDYFFLNENEMNLLTEGHGETVNGWLEVAKERDASFIITRGGEGVDICMPDGLAKSYKTKRQEVTGNVLGAGDLFMSVAIKEMFFDGQSLPDAIAIAMEHATKILERDDANIGTYGPLAENIQVVTNHAHHDQLTGALNRHGLERYLDSPDVHPADLHMMVIDADYFKEVNDSHGHDVGDEALVSLVQSIQGHMRLQDVVARFGGEEFICFVKGMTDKQAHSVAERIRKSIAEKKHTSENLNLTVSIGLCKWQPTDTLDEIMKRSDEALYKAKEIGRNVVVKGTFVS